MRVMVTVSSPAAKPMSTLFGGQPISASASSFSARTTRKVLPKVPLSVWCGRKPAMFRSASRQKRPTEVLGMKPSRSTPCS